MVRKACEEQTLDQPESGSDRQRRAPFFDALTGYRDAGIQPYSTPGHKLGQGTPPEFVAALGPAVLGLDVPIGGGVDDTHRTAGTQRQAERLAAEAWGADDAAFLVNGSSTGNIAFLLATCRPGDTVLVGRNLHTSLLSGLILSGAMPVYLYPEVHPDLNLTLDISPTSVRDALDNHPEARAVVLVSPSYTGVSSDLPRIAAICRDRNTPLFIDEAWGPHFPFHPDLPPGATQAGASGGVTSIHKLLAGLTQSSLMTFAGPLVSRRDVGPAISLIETTSPSALIAASIDVARRQMALHGRELLDTTLALAHDARSRIARLPGFTVISEEVVAGRQGAGFDPTRIMIDVQGLGLTGFEAETLLRAEARIGVEMSDLTAVMVHITIGDTRESVDHLINGLTWLSERPDKGASTGNGNRFRSSGSVVLSAQPALTPREAALGATRTIPLTSAAGQISAEIITPYPPGIPVVAPGDMLTEECIDYLNAARRAGVYISGPQDPKLARIRVAAAS